MLKTTSELALRLTARPWVLTKELPDIESRPRGRSRIGGALRHPTERGEGRSRFDAAAEAFSNLASSAAFFLLCVLLIGLWLVGLVLGFPGGTENALTGTMTAFALLLIAVLKNSERRAERAMQRKLDAITQAMLAARGGGDQAEVKAISKRQSAYTRSCRRGSQPGTGVDVRFRRLLEQALVMSHPGRPRPQHAAPTASCS